MLSSPFVRRSNNSRHVPFPIAMLPLVVNYGQHSNTQFFAASKEQLMPEKPIADHESKCTLGEDAREFIITQAKAAAREFNKRRKEVIQ